MDKFDKLKMGKLDVENLGMGQQLEFFYFLLSSDKIKYLSSF